MSKEKLSWWDDPKNKKEVYKISWWEHKKNQEIFPLPISVIQDGDYWIATCNNKTKKYLGDKLYGCSQGKTKEEAINKMFEIIRMTCDYYDECTLNYRRFVPFTKGNWKIKGGKWFTIFGIFMYFRYGKGMKGGWYVPFTKLNISISNYWVEWRKYKKKL